MIISTIKSKSYSILSAVFRRIHKHLGYGFAGNLSHEMEVKIARDCLPKTGAVVFDVGAHVGRWSKALLSQAGEQIDTIYAFEPNPTSLKSIMAEAASCLTVVPMGLSDHKGTAPLYSHTPGATLSSLYMRDLSNYNIEFKEEAMIELTTVDHFVEEHSITRVDFLKLDVEGHEMQTLKGATKSIKNGKINAVAFEFGGCNIDSKVFFKEYWNFFIAHNFDLYIINPISGLQHIPTYSEVLEVYLTTNYVAIRKGSKGA